MHCAAAARASRAAGREGEDIVLQCAAAASLRCWRGTRTQDRNGKDIIIAAAYYHPPSEIKVQVKFCKTLKKNGTKVQFKANIGVFRDYLARDIGLVFVWPQSQEGGDIAFALVPPDARFPGEEWMGKQHVERTLEDWREMVGDFFCGSAAVLGVRLRKLAVEKRERDKLERGIR